MPAPNRTGHHAEEGGGDEGGGDEGGAGMAMRNRAATAVFRRHDSLLTTFRLVHVYFRSLRGRPCLSPNPAPPARACGSNAW